MAEAEMIEQLTAGTVSLLPLRFAKAKTIAASTNSYDLLLDASWKKMRARFAVECRAQSTPRTFEAAVLKCQSISPPRGTLPMLVVPYLRESQLLELEQRGLSGIDLCGNGVVIVPGKVAIFRTGSENRYASNARIKNIYRKNTSMVARAMFALPISSRVQAIGKAVNERNPFVARLSRTAMQLSTVSKALKGMEEDLIVDRTNGIRLVQPDKLLDKLAENYEALDPIRRKRFKVDVEPGQLPLMLRTQADAASVLVTATGVSSVARYAVMQRGDVLSVYCSKLEPLIERLQAKENDRFPNVELIETDDQTLYFDARDEDGFFWASPLQTYVELIAGDKRDRETADQVKTFILRQIQGIQR